MKKGYFITFEGPDGSGKTTVSTAVAKRLQEAGIESIYTREPGGIEIAEQIRSVILDPANTAMDSKTEALLYAAARRQHLIEKSAAGLRSGESRDLRPLCRQFAGLSGLRPEFRDRGGFVDQRGLRSKATGRIKPCISIWRSRDWTGSPPGKTKTGLIRKRSIFTCASAKAIGRCVTGLPNG